MVSPDFEKKSPDIIRVLIAIHSENELRAVRSLVDQQDDMSVVGILGSGHDVMHAVAGFRPHVVLVDMFLPGVEGLETTLRIKSLDHPPHVIVMTPEDGAAYKLAIEQAEADGYVPYPLVTKVLVPLIRSFFRGTSG